MNLCDSGFEQMKGDRTLSLIYYLFYSINFPLQTLLLFSWLSCLAFHREGGDKLCLNIFSSKSPSCFTHVEEQREKSSQIFNVVKRRGASAKKPIQNCRRSIIKTEPQNARNHMAVLPCSNYYLIFS